MKRMAEMSRFECVVRVCRNRFWRDIPSSDLVPGDILEVSASNLHTVPCDAVLLTGDCILNESMLTGESIPVSKLPVTDTALRCMDLSAANIPADVAKHFLFSGTKIVRVRTQSGGIKGAKLGELGNEEAEAEDSMAIAMVVRTGFNTAKGALVRSMLFPKPNKFQFYRDSFRFIGVLAIIGEYLEPSVHMR
ncbi:hypothetical protein BC937DRAFT_94588 [Endogone sp. FLAS-F59071]|nr:hypothetical protein BC937DRAFT_94588 [Endogone sp. FLAS-F59071]|eukprot:RUS13928.1 hypothetical protein BC937DRAFT_94588 [Endogone sp. FLAS-F59071]